jgi:uncharacterized OsmC-like protein
MDTAPERGESPSAADIAILFVPGSASGDFMTAPAPSTIREYDVSARSTATFGRVECSARNHHFIVDGPVQNGCPGEELTPPELFLSAVASCGVELIHVIARDEKKEVGSVEVKIHGIVDRAKQPRADVTTFTRVELDFRFAGTDSATAAALVEGFKRR